MSKKAHPIRKITKRLDTAFWYKNGKPEKIIARHVRPLLDVGMGKIPHLYAGLCYDSAFPENAGDPECPACRLFAAWKEPIK